jgi:hypothetical protein
MTECTEQLALFGKVGRAQVEAGFDGGQISSDAGGALLLRQAEQRFGLLQAAVQCLPDDRDRDKIRHSRESQLKQRVFGIALGYEDLNDHDTLRKDEGLQLALNQRLAASSSSTLCRFEHAMGRREAVALHGVLMEHFIASHREVPTELVLDLDATDDPVHGQQAQRFFHGYYDGYCFLPLYVFCGDELLVAYLRPANIDGAKHAAAIVKWLVRRLRQAWPQVRITIRGDSGFCRRRLLCWCERNEVKYVIGLAKNARLSALAAESMAQAQARFELSGEKQRGFAEFRYAAGTWPHERRVILRYEHGAQGSNPRYIVTNRDDEAGHLYDGVYCQRGEMENRIKEQQLGLFADRTSCSAWWPNQFRLLQASLAYALMQGIRRIALTGTELARAQCTTIRLKLFKIGGTVIRSVRRIRVLLASQCPYRELFMQVARRLAAEPGG